MDIFFIYRLEKMNKLVILVISFTYQQTLPSALTSLFLVFLHDFQRWCTTAFSGLAWRTPSLWETTRLFTTHTTAITEFEFKKLRHDQPQERVVLSLLHIGTLINKSEVDSYYLLRWMISSKKVSGFLETNVFDEKVARTCKKNLSKLIHITEASFSEQVGWVYMCECVSAKKIGCFFILTCRIPTLLLFSMADGNESWKGVFVRTMITHTSQEM